VREKVAKAKTIDSVFVLCRGFGKRYQWYVLLIFYNNKGMLHFATYLKMVIYAPI